MDPLSDDVRESAERPKKRVIDPKSWKKHDVKRKRDSGLTYTSPHNKQQVPAKTLGPPCTCPKECYDVIGKDNAQLIFDEYWGLRSHNDQSSYLMNRIVMKDVKHRYGQDESKRSHTREYTVMVNKKVISVCMVAFLNLHSTSEKRVCNVISKTGVTGASVDKRGTNLSKNEKKENPR